MELSSLPSDCHAAIDGILGYLNFSQGSADPRFRKHCDTVYAQLDTGGSDATPGVEMQGVLVARLAELAATAAEPFRDVSQAAAVIDLAFRQVPGAYKQFHRDLLHYQSDRTLFGPFFLARSCEAVLTAGAPWDESARIVEAAVTHLNDFLGYRPVAVLHSRQKMEPYAHEWVCPLPWYWQGVGVQQGPYRALIEGALAVLRQTDSELLDAASFDLERLDELALDPRAYDFDHPANKRPNHHFGQWDPWRIDRHGYYRRFVLQGVTLDAIYRRTHEHSDIPLAERQTEAATVLAGTILMASMVSGNGPEAHDSSVTLAKLVPKIAALRDAFYERQLERLSEPHGQRLRAEATRLRQPFGGARQHLNRQLARLRASQLEHVHLANLYARLGYAEAAGRQAEIVPVASARMLSEINSRLALGRQLVERGDLAALAAPLDEIDDLLKRGIECGALVDPWNILGFQGQFSLFPAIENSVRDHRVDVLIHLMTQLFALLVQTTAEAAANGQREIEHSTLNRLGQLARWWDQFGSAEVSSVEPLSGAAELTAARQIAAALGAWQQAQVAAGDIKFWRGQIEHLQSPNSCALVVQTLLGRNDLVAARALLAHWLGQADEMALAGGGVTFHDLAGAWLRRTLSGNEGSTTAERWHAAVKFFDFLEAAAEAWWQAPQFELGANQHGSIATAMDEEDEEADENPYAAAYDDVVYRDTTGDGVEGSMLEGGAAPTDLEWDAEATRLGERLALLTTVARLWRESAVWSAVNAIDDRGETLLAWYEQVRRNSSALLGLLDSVAGYRLPSPGPSHELMVEYDRRRLAKESLLGQIIGACVELSVAERFLIAALPGDDFAAAAAAQGEGGEAVSSAWLGAPLLSALVEGRFDEARSQWPALQAKLDEMPILYMPVSRGGDPRRVVAAESLHQHLQTLVRLLPRAGMLVEACQLLATAQAMERHRIKGEAAVSEFDRLFETGGAAILDTLVSAAPDTEEADDELLDALEPLSESLLKVWTVHQRSLRLSVLEKLHDNNRWQATIDFVQRWGHEIFTPRFMNLGNLRAVLHASVATFFEQLEEADDCDWPLLEALDNQIARPEAAERLTTILEAVVENYAEYKDYNATTTQSDRGEMLFVLLDFLRLKASYERFVWTIRPLMLAHEVLVRRGKTVAAEQWRRGIVSRTSDAADWHLRRLDELVKKYGMVLPTIADRLRERFVRPLAIDRIRAFIQPAVEELRAGEPLKSFPQLEREVDELADVPTGAGLDAPVWLLALEDEAERALRRISERSTVASEAFDPPAASTSWEELLAQLRSPEQLP